MANVEPGPIVRFRRSLGYLLLKGGPQPAAKVYRYVSRLRADLGHPNDCTSHPCPSGSGQAVADVSDVVVGDVLEFQRVDETDPANVQRWLWYGLVHEQPPGWIVVEKFDSDRAAFRAKADYIEAFADAQRPDSLY